MMNMRTKEEGNDMNQLKPKKWLVERSYWQKSKGDKWRQIQQHTLHWCLITAKYKYTKYFEAFVDFHSKVQGKV